MKYRLSTVLNALCVCVITASLLPACGGRYQTQRELDDDTVSGGSGSGAPSVGHGGSAPSRGGSGSAGAASSAGTSGAVNSCNNVNCAPTACPAGSLPIVRPGECCATACSACGECPLIKCASGSRLEYLPGNCCPTCSDDGGAACQMGRDAYATQRELFLSKYQYGCASASECVVMAPVNSCEKGCSYAAVWYGAVDFFDANLSNAAAMYCSSCKPTPVPACNASTAVQCVGGQCRLGYVK